MKRKLVISMLAAALTISALPASMIGAKTTTTTTTITEESEYDEESDGLDDEETDGSEGINDGDDDFAGELTKSDIRTSPARKIIKVGRSFSINVIPEDDTEWEDLLDVEWEELCDENIDEITFRSSDSSVASVNKKTGLVKARKKGTAVIKTKINLVNGESATYKTKVYVTR